MSATVAAVDLGASSGRVVVGRRTSSGFVLEEVHRFPNVPRVVEERLRWDARGLYEGVLDGLRIATERFGGLDSVGVDSWAVDYGALDADGALIEDPISYRDARTDDAVAAVLGDLGPEALYEATGTQLQPFNTMFQLMARAPTLQRAHHVLLIADLIGYWLTGEPGTEVTNASTTQLLDPRTMSWSDPLATRLGVSMDLFSSLRRPGQALGAIRPELSLGAAHVVTVPSHDTAAAVAGIPAEADDFAYVCTGTWALVGLEVPSPVITETTRLANFTNEVGVDGTIRFLRNLTGFWLVQECVRAWGGEVDLNALAAAAADVPTLRSVIDVQDPRFAVPGDMPRRITAAAIGPAISSRAETIRCILDSLALAVRAAVRDAADLAGRDVRVVHVVGGGVSNELFCQLIADACELPVIAGPTEAASWGNAMAQARALGVVGDSLAETREVIRDSERPRIHHPRGDGEVWARAEKLVADHRE